MENIFDVDSSWTCKSASKKPYTVDF